MEDAGGGDRGGALRLGHPGRRHRAPGVAGRAKAPDGGTYVNLGSWTFDDATYATYSDGEVEVFSFPERRPICDEEYRGILGPHRGKSFFDWWERYYRGWLRYDIEAMRRDARG